MSMVYVCLSRFHVKYLILKIINMTSMITGLNKIVKIQFSFSHFNWGYLSNFILCKDQGRYVLNPKEIWRNF